MEWAYWGFSKFTCHPISIMSIEQRRHIRFSLEIPAFRQTKYGEAIATVLHQIGIGGCLLEWDDNIFVGDEFRLLARIPNRNFLPLHGRAVYVFPDNGIGVRFLDITQFEQDLIAEIISHCFAQQGLPKHMDPFAHPKEFLNKNKNPMPKITDIRRQNEEILDDILSIHDNC